MQNYPERIQFLTFYGLPSMASSEKKRNIPLILNKHLKKCNMDEKQRRKENKKKGSLQQNN